MSDGIAGYDGFVTYCYMKVFGHLVVLHNENNSVMGDHRLGYRDGDMSLGKSQPKGLPTNVTALKERAMEGGGYYRHSDGVSETSPRGRGIKAFAGLIRLHRDGQPIRYPG